MRPPDRGRTNDPGQRLASTLVMAVWALAWVALAAARQIRASSSTGVRNVRDIRQTVDL